jgi:hypothetical protein
MDNDKETTAAAGPAAETKEKKPRAKRAKAKAKPKAEAKPPRAKKGESFRTSTVYAPSAKLNEKAIEELGDQAKIVAATLVKKAPVTLAQLAELVTGKLTTRQDPKRVVAFYLTQFKADGLVKKAA